MNGDAISMLCNIPARTVRSKTQKAKDDGLSTIRLGDRVFLFSIESGHYRYEEVLPEVIDTSDSDLSAAWRLASDDKRADAADRVRLINEYRNRKAGMGWKEFLKRVSHRYESIKPTKSKLFRWLQTMEECEINGGTAMEHLLDTRGKSSKNRSYTDEMYDYMTQLFLENPDIRKTKLSIYMEQRYGERTPSYATINRMLERYKRENVLIATLAANPGDANNKLRPAPGSASEKAPYINALWEMDGTPADVICSDGVRYALSAAIDVYSRMVVVVVTPRANSSALSQVFKRGIQKLGVPEAVKLDNGKEYKSRHFEYVCARLKIEQQFSMPYSGWQKPHIERFFRTLSTDLFEELPGYIGHNVSERERISNRQTHEQKLQAIDRWKIEQKNGSEFAKKFSLKKENLGIDVNIPVSREELEGYIEQWIEKYERRNHRGIGGERPIDRWQHSGAIPRTISDERVLDVLVGLSEKKQITKKGVTWKKLSYWNDILYDRVGESVWMLSDDELGYIYLYDLNMQYLCKAENAELIGKSRSEYMASRWYDAKSKRLIKELQELRRQMPQRFKSLLVNEEQTQIDEIAVEFKSAAVNAVREAVADQSGYDAYEQRELADQTVETIVVNGRPTFTKRYDRFLWDLENGMVEESTHKLADKYPDIWDMAVAEYERRKAS